jgi:hypothetical protein
VTALLRSDFTLKENGVKHDIAAVAYMTSAERTIAVPAEARNADTPGFLTVALRPSGCTSRRKRIPPTSRACAMRCGRFVSTQLQPGFKLSIGGRAFTASAPKPLLQISMLLPS